MAQTPDDTPGFATLLEQAVHGPGLIHQGYSAFHDYSLGNQLLALAQCAERNLPPGPIATYPKWKELGRHVRKGEKALSLIQPWTRTIERRDEDGATADPIHIKRFYLRSRWFTIAQTEGKDYVPAPLPDWNADCALETLKIVRVPFDHIDGNAWGFARRGRQLAVSPISPMPERTLIHEIAHIELGHCDEADEQDGPTLTHSDREVEAEAVAYLVTAALALPGAEYSAGYLQHYLKRGGEHTERTAQRVFSIADKVLRAGRQEPSTDAAENSLEHPND
jgi:hypothetical protein